MADSDARQHARQSVTLTGKLRLGEHVDAPSIGCEVQNLSVGGAKIKVVDHVDPSSPVVLDIAPFGRYEADLAWVRHPLIGIRFRDPPEVMAELMTALALHA
jgi:hypothetical protein